MTIIIIIVIRRSHSSGLNDDVPSLLYLSSPSLELVLLAIRLLGEQVAVAFLRLQ